jgi:PhzF family phenazine biosynthesis protein
MNMVELLHIAAFSDGNVGGNPAGVWLGEQLPTAAEMQAIAAQVGFSETAFAAPLATGFRVRYFAPEIEIPFCGHATIALGAALALRHGSGVYPLTLNDANITVEGHATGETMGAALQSPPTRSAPAQAKLLADTLALFKYTVGDLEPAIPPALIHAGARHIVLALKSREKLREMSYDLAAGRKIMIDAGLVTICLVHITTTQEFNVRNAFAAGGVLEDPATGAAAAAFGAYLRDLNWPHNGEIKIIQGEDMGMRSRIHVNIPPGPGCSIRVSGQARVMAQRQASN